VPPGVAGPAWCPHGERRWCGGQFVQPRQRHAGLHQLIGDPAGDGTTEADDCGRHGRVVGGEHLHRDRRGVDGLRAPFAAARIAGGGDLRQQSRIGDLTGVGHRDRRARRGHQQPGTDDRTDDRGDDRSTNHSHV
jgi:hypothetical protein